VTAPAAGLRLTADAHNAFKFDKTALTAKAGAVTITLSNPSVLPHNVAIRGNGVDVKGKVVIHGGTSVVTARLKPGTYTFYCSVPGHAAAGMKGTLTVKP
jgi:plastocyanin